MKVTVPFVRLFVPCSMGPQQQICSSGFAAEGPAGRR